MSRSTKRTRQAASAWSTWRTPRGAVDEQVGLGLELGRGLVRAHADAQRRAQAAVGHEAAQPREGVEVRPVVPDVDPRVEAGVGEQMLDAAALVEAHGRADLEHLAAPVGDQPGRLGPLGDRAHRELGGVLVRRAAPVEGGDDVLVLAPHAQAAQRLVLQGAGREVADALRPRPRPRGRARRPSAPPRRISAPWLPTYVIVPSDTIRRAVAAWRPVTQATRP